MLDMNSQKLTLHRPTHSPTAEQQNLEIPREEKHGLIAWSGKQNGEWSLGLWEGEEELP